MLTYLSGSTKPSQANLTLPLSRLPSYCLQGTPTVSGKIHRLPSPDHSATP
jgi:hypothetical protein